MEGFCKELCILMDGAPGIGEGSLIAVVGRFGPLKKTDALEKWEMR